jgi:hypothetical protein
MSTVACKWYYAWNRQDLRYPIAQGFIWAFFTHIGTVAFGGLVLTIIWPIKKVMGYIRKTAQTSNGKGGGNGMCLLSCVECMSLCLEEMVEFLSKHAYIETILHNAAFCNGGREAKKLTLLNITRIRDLHTITALPLLFGTIFIAALVSFASFFINSFFNFAEFETLYPIIVRLLLHPRF